MRGQFVAEQTLVHGRFALSGRRMSILTQKRRQSGYPSDKTDERRTEDDDWKRNVEKEYADESSGRECHRHGVFERAFTNAKNSLKDDGEDSCLEPEEERDNDRHLPPSSVHITQRHDGDDAG